MGYVVAPVIVPCPPSPPLPSSIYPHHPYLLLFPFSSDVVVVALDGVRSTCGRRGDVASFGASLAAGDVALSGVVVGIVVGVVGGQ